MLSPIPHKNSAPPSHSNERFIPFRAPMRAFPRGCLLYYASRISASAASARPDRRLLRAIEFSQQNMKATRRPASRLPFQGLSRHNWINLALAVLLVFYSAQVVLDM